MIDPSHTQHDQPQNNGHSPQKFTQYFIQLLAMHFSDPGNIVHPSMKQYIWSPNDEVNQEVKTKIEITTISRFDATKMYMRPAIILKRKETATRPQTAIGEAYQDVHAYMGQPGLDPNNFATAGGQMFEYSVGGQMQFACLHEEGAAAELLGDEVWRLLLGVMPLLANELGLWEWNPLTMGELVKVEEAKDHWAVIVNLSYVYRQKIIVRPQTPILKYIKTYLIPRSI